MSQTVEPLVDSVKPGSLPGVLDVLGTSADPSLPLTTTVDNGRFNWADPVSELLDAARNWWKWLSLARFVIKRRYYTTGLGPVWSLLTNAVFIFGICFLYSGAFGLTFNNYVVHLGMGYIIWTLVTDTFGAGASVFVGEYKIYSQLKVNKLGLILKGVFTRSIIFFYNLPLFAVIIWFAGDYSHIWWTAILGFVAIFINSFFASYWLSVISARFRDVPHIIMTIIRFGFFFTPILWEPAAVGQGIRGLFVVYNPFFHFIELMRAPFKVSAVPWDSWMFVLGCTILNILIFLITYRLAHRNIVLFSA